MKMVDTRVLININHSKNTIDVGKLYSVSFVFYF